MMRSLLLVSLALLIPLIGFGGWRFLTTGERTNDFENVALTVTAPVAPAPGETEAKTDSAESADRPSAPENSETPAGENKKPEPSTETQGAEPKLEILPKFIAFGYRVPPNPRSVDTVIIHSSYNAIGGDVYDIDKILKQYENYGVGAHYLIGRAGSVYRLVDEKNIAYHAGVSKMPDGRKNVNDFSIGIELVGTEGGGYTGKQYAALNALIADIKKRHTVRNIVGHSDIAPDRKTDPWEFDWKKLK